MTDLASHLRRLAETTRSQNEIEIVDCIIRTLIAECERVAKGGYFHYRYEFTPETEACNHILIKEAIDRRLEDFSFRSSSVQIFHTSTVTYRIDVAW